jgi:hypothetical protein
MHESNGVVDELTARFCTNFSRPFEHEDDEHEDDHFGWASPRRALSRAALRFLHQLLRSRIALR